MRIEIDNLKNRGGKFSKVYQVGELALGESDVRLTEPAAVQVYARRDGNEIILTGELEAQVETPCGRCLKPVVLPIHDAFKERFVPVVTWRNEEQHELKTEDLDLGILTGEEIDFDELVREQILLAVPDHVLCREDCKGLCPSCGRDRNLEPCTCEEASVDSRWQKLKDIKDQASSFKDRNREM